MTNNSPVSDRIPVAPLREAFEQSGLTPSQVCYALGWTCSSPHGVRADTTRLARALGIARNSNRSHSLATRIGYDHAARIAEAIGVDPLDVGL